MMYCDPSGAVNTCAYYTCDTATYECTFDFTSTGFFTVPLVYTFEEWAATANALVFCNYGY